MDKLISAIGDGDPLHHFIPGDGTSVNIEETLRGTDQNRAAENRVHVSARMKLKRLEKLSSADLKELDEYFTALEEERRDLQYLLEEQKQEHRTKLNAVERERIQERLEWEVKMQERQEALHSAVMSVAIAKNKMKKDLMARPAVCSSSTLAPDPLKELRERVTGLEEDRMGLQYLMEEQKQEHEKELNAVESSRIQERLEWEVKMQEREEALYSAVISLAIGKHKIKKGLMARPVVCTSSVLARDHNNNVLQETAALQERVRSTEMAKKQKALLKEQSAEQKRQEKALQKAQKEARKKAEKAGGKKGGKKQEEGNDSSSQSGCSAQSDAMTAEQQDRKDKKKTVGCFGFLFRRRRATKAKETDAEQ